jgi:hypothetical protein
MKPLFRAFLLAGALLSSGALQVTAAVGEDGCCPEDESVPCPDVPLGVACACACCPSSCAVQGSPPDVAPAASPAVAVAIVIAEPSLDASVAEIFQPPRR